MRRCWTAAATGCALFPLVALAAEPGDQVAVVYNRRAAPDSLRVAEYYATRRHIPTNQIIGLNLPTTEVISRTDYQDQLEKPLLHELENRGLISFHDDILPATSEKPGEVIHRPVAAKIRYLVLCYGMPLRILHDPNLVEPGLDKLRPELHRNGAAVDSELACLPRAGVKHLLAGPLPNPFFDLTNTATLHPTNGILMVARLDGPSASLARGLVDKAIEAETDGLWGRAYFDLRGLTAGAYKPGDDWIRTAYRLIRRQGIESVLDERPETFPASFPMPQIALYAGWYDGTVAGPFAQPRVEFMPGAIAYHLHSYSAATVRSPTENWVGPLVAKGAAATVGYVDEPYLDGTIEVGVFFGRMVYSRFTFGEAAYAAQPVLSWQTTVLGDPLYRPFGRSAKELHEELEARQSRLLEWSYLRIVNLNLVTELPPSDLITYLEQPPAVSVTRKSAVLEQKLGELYHAVGKTDRAIDEYGKALALDPSPQQRLQLELTLAPWLTSQNRSEEALDVFKRFLRDHPDYPDPSLIYEKALGLAKKLGLNELADEYAKQLGRSTPGK